ncbi:MAG: class I SAM-dependent methyltransferase [Verrucomicrobia bacterium]|nr:class I SAM-dependent methyltransferase [Verrucomicrobiota bacterium]
MIPCLLFEDEHLLAVAKPAGWDLRASGPCAGEGIFDWLRHREPRWARLAAVHPRSAEVSGVAVFALSEAAAQALKQQFAESAVEERFLFLTDRPAGDAAREIRSGIARASGRCEIRPLASGSPTAHTRFRSLGPDPGGTRIEAVLVAGTTDSIRVHAAACGWPILGDSIYGGSAAPRLMLHAAGLRLRHPASGAPLAFETPPEFDQPPFRTRRLAIIDPKETTAYRLIHGGADGWPGWFVDRLEDDLLAASTLELTPGRRALLDSWRRIAEARAVYYRLLTRPSQNQPAERPRLDCAAGSPGPGRFAIRENDLRFLLRMGEGGAGGLFLDQRDNRRRLLAGHVAAGFPLFPDGAAGRTVLNTFAYTAAFSVCAAAAGAHTVSLDLSRNYLEWGRDNFRANGIDPAEHEFVVGDVFSWLKRWRRRERFFDLVILDPPTFSRSREHGAFRAEEDYAALAQGAIAVLRRGGVLLASSNAAQWPPADFQDAIESAAAVLRRRILRRHYAPQPPDFPAHPDTPAYLKTLWLRLE